jgi:LacI family transcriptional regulator, repressor for deo operon, udp, cdd, tsx, nupC, and nupG
MPERSSRQRGSSSSASGRAGRPTIDDVAREAGVSLATVSRALRGLPHVRQEVRDRVIQAAESLRYVADTNAARLASGRARTIGLISPILTTWYTSQVIAGIEDVLQVAGYDLLISALSSPQNRRRLLEGRLTFQQRVDGIVSVDLFLGAEGVARLQPDLPMVTIGESIEGSLSIGIDNEHGGRLAAEHLCELGHRDFLIIGGAAPEIQFSPVPQLRKAGFLAVLAEHGLPAVAEVDGEFSIEGGYRATMTAMRGSNPPTALFCFSDEMAFGSLQAARELGLRVPADLSIVGFDDHEVAAALGLSTVRQPVRELGRRGAHRVLAALEQGTIVSGHDVFPVELVVRSSSAPPPLR